VGYHLQLDPQEKTNRVQDPEYREVLEVRRVRLDRWVECTRDPLEKGGIKVPSDAKINSRHETDPRSEPYLSTDDL
jgi:hypothetical protein